MEKYIYQCEIGSGSFAVVNKAINKETQEVVAIKKMRKKFYSWDECLALREVKSLRKLKHNNIIAMKEAVRKEDELFLIFEFVSSNVYQKYCSYKEKGQQMPEAEIKSVIHQTAQGLAHMHKNGFFHRDLKPENLVIDNNNVVKIIDFGLAREIRSAPPYTDYVATRWYRAPEILLKSSYYNSPTDIFSLGCIMAELYLLTPIFCGNSEIDQIHKICSVIGTPDINSWPEGLKLAARNGIQFPEYQAVDLIEYLPKISQQGATLIKEMLQFDPAKRPTASQIMNHPFFKELDRSNIMKDNFHTTNHSKSAQQKEEFHSDSFQKNKEHSEKKNQDNKKALGNDIKEFFNFKPSINSQKNEKPNPNIANGFVNFGTLKGNESPTKFYGRHKFD